MVNSVAKKKADNATRQDCVLKESKTEQDRLHFAPKVYILLLLRGHSQITLA